MNIFYALGKYKICLELHSKEIAVTAINVFAFTFGSVIYFLISYIWPWSFKNVDKYNLNTP